jgi:hypothetical protein
MCNLMIDRFAHNTIIVLRYPKARGTKTRPAPIWEQDGVYFCILQKVRSEKVAFVKLGKNGIVATHSSNISEFGIRHGVLYS